MLFREMNERIRGVNDGFQLPTPSYGVFCECGRAECVERLDVPIDVFNDVCSGDGLFLVSPSHELDVAVRVVDGNGVYRVVLAAA